MAKLTALPSLDIIRGFKGTLDFYIRRGQPCVRKWPHTPRSRRTPATIAAAALFGGILKSYRLVADTVLAAYQENAKGIPRTPRDVYVSGVLGHLHERTIPEPPPPPPEVIMTGPWLNPETTTYSTSAYAWKGNYAKPMRALALSALGAKGDWPQGITLKFGVFTVAGGVITAVVHKSTGVALPPALDINPSASRVWEILDPPWALDAGTLYLIMVGRSDGADDYALPVAYPEGIHPAPFPAHETALSTGRIAKADPLVGDSVNHYVATVGLLATWSFT
ncbi:hypothetical protein ES708_11476 [subsurface metagenome]